MGKGAGGNSLVRTPVAVCVYNRPDLAKLVLQAIARAQPKQLFVIADGPASRDDVELCARTVAETRKIAWDCDVRYEVSSVNLGARQRISSGLDWVFSQVSEAIILEDDCIPDDSFFHFCDEALERYRDDSRVMMVSGSNYLDRWKADLQSCHFSHFGSIWGWASWSRAWKFYDVKMAAWGDEEVKARIRDLLADNEVFEFQARRFDRIYGDPGDRHSWDPPWIFARLAQSGVAVVPAVNLVSNVGPAHGKGLPSAHPLASLRAQKIDFPLRFPEGVATDREYDRLHVRRIVEWWQMQARTAREPYRRTRPLRTVHRTLRRAVRLARKGAGR